MASRNSWKQAQMNNQACSVAIKLLNSGKPPPRPLGKNTGEYWNDIRKYCRDASLAADGTLIVKTPPSMLTGDIERERIVIPKILVPALLHHMHNHLDMHPAKAQQKAMFQRKFYALALDKHLDLLYKNCYRCAIVQKLPKEIIANETKTEVDHPHSHFHVDVIRRAKQFILTIRDHFSSFQDAILINSEKADDLKDGLLTLITALRKPSTVYITVDNSPGFKSLITTKDQTLEKHKIKLIGTDIINKNANAVVDKGCKELEEEMKRLDPEGKPISIATLKLAILNLNSRLRRKGCISAFEIHTARDQESNENLHLKDEILRTNQLQTRSQQQNTIAKPVEEGDTVTIKNSNNKHTANDMYVITKKNGDDVDMQKLIHPLAAEPARLMNKVYHTNQKYLTTLHRPETLNEETDFQDDEENYHSQPEEQNTFKTQWSPINIQFFETDDDSDEDIECISLSKTYKKTSIKKETDTEDLELQWDHTPEQYELESTDMDNFEHLLLPRPIFNEENLQDQETLSSDDDVFMPNTPPERRSTKLTRRNAIRRKKNNTEPRVTRQRLSTLTRNSNSQPTSPTAIQLNRCQNLDAYLRPRHPIVNEVVSLQHVQNLHNVLQPNVPRRSSRNRIRVDYARLHHGGYSTTEEEERTR